MELSRIAISVTAVIVINAVSDVACLLNFSYETASTNSMHTTCWEEEHITGFNLIFLHDVHDCAFFYALDIIFWSRLLRETAI